jgi:hypothetical protein
VTALVLEPRVARDRDRAGAAGPQSGSADVGGGPTLDALLAGVWEGLAAHKSVACPVCMGEMTPDYGVHARPVGGRCTSCGTRLS